MSGVTPKIETADQLDEMRARAIASALCEQETWKPWVAYARAIREADKRAGFTTVRGFDASEVPHPAVNDAYPLVLYFPSKAEADEFVAIVQEAKPGMVAVELEGGHDADARLP